MKSEPKPADSGSPASSAGAPPEVISEIAAILARGYLRYRKSRRRLLNEVDSAAEPSRHVSVVDDQRTEEN